MTGVRGVSALIGRGPGTAPTPPPRLWVPLQMPPLEGPFLPPAARSRPDGPAETRGVASLWSVSCPMRSWWLSHASWRPAPNPYAADGHAGPGTAHPQPGLLTLRATGGWLGGGHSLTLLVHVDGDPAQGCHRVHQQQALVPGGRGSREQEGRQTLPRGGVSGGALRAFRRATGEAGEPPTSHRCLLRGSQPPGTSSVSEPG